MGADSWSSALYAVASRLLAGQLQGAYLYVEYFPLHQDWLWGLSFPNPAGIFPFEPYLLTQEMSNWYSPRDAKNGIQGSMPTVYWGEMYANFGLFGVLAFPGVVGYLLYAGNALLFTQKLTPVAVALFIWLLMHYLSLSGTSWSGFIIDIGLFVFVVIYWVVSKLVPNIFRNINKNRRMNFNN
jgi:hypothetical protein